VSQITTICSTCRKHLPVLSSFMTFTGFVHPVTRLIRRVSLVKQELSYTLLEHLSSPPVLTGVRVTRSLVLCVCFVDRCLSFWLFCFGHCVVCHSSIYGFWLPLWYRQTLLSAERVLTYECVFSYSSVLWCPLRFPPKTMFSSSLFQFVL